MVFISSYSRRRLSKKYKAECTRLGNCGNSSFVVRGTMMMLVGHANKRYHDVYLDYADHLFLPDRSKLLHVTLFLIYIYILLNQ